VIFEDIDTIKAAAKDAYGVLVNAVPTFGSTKEADYVENIVNASKEAGASAAVYISGFLLNRKEEFPNYGPSHPFYFINESKERAEKAARQAGLEYWTIFTTCCFYGQLLYRSVPVPVAPSIQGAYSANHGVIWR